MELASGRAARDRHVVAWNVVGLGIAGLAGVLLLVAIAALHGPEALGRFNLLFATYLIGAQVATLGLHVSVVRYAASLSAGPRRTTVVYGAIIAVFASGSVAALLLLLLRYPLVLMLGRPELAEGMRYVAVGILLFSINKVLLAALTAAGAMREHALLTAARGVLMLGMLALLSVMGTTGEDLIVVLVLSEGTLAALLAFATRRAFSGGASLQETLRWTLRHLRFGLLGAGSTLLTELNIRVDILVLAFFVDDRAIGIYTLVATLSEAALQLPSVYRTVLGPGIVRLIERPDLTGLREQVRNTRVRLWSVMALFAGGLMSLFPGLARMLDADRAFLEGWPVLAILLVGVVVASGYVPFSLALAQGGRPLAQTGLVGALVLINLAGNLALVPTFGLIGAAVATAAAQVVSIPLLRLTAKRSLGLRL